MNPTDAPWADLEALLAPISDELPCGPSLRYDAVMDRLRELRREEDASLPTGVWQAELKRGDWAELERLAASTLAARSKDLMLAAWLGEAWLHRLGIAGLAGALALLAGLCERYPDSLHPQPEDGDPAWRAAPIDWLVRRYAEVLLIRVPLSAEHPELTLNAWKLLQRRQVQASDAKADKASAEAARQEHKRLIESVRHGPLNAWLQAANNLDGALRDLERLRQWCDDSLGEDAPSVQPLGDVMLSIRSVIQEFIAMLPQAPVPPADSPALAEQPGQTPSAAPSLPAGQPGSREEAYRQLAMIADYLARTEPHSPVPYIIRRAVEWGGLPLSALLDELVNADPEARRVWSMLGVLR